MTMTFYNLKQRNDDDDTTTDEDLELLVENAEQLVIYSKQNGYSKNLTNEEYEQALSCSSYHSYMDIDGVGRLYQIAWSDGVNSLRAYFLDNKPISKEEYETYLAFIP